MGRTKSDLDFAIAWIWRVSEYLDTPLKLSKLVCLRFVLSLPPGQLQTSDCEYQQGFYQLKTAIERELNSIILKIVIAQFTAVSDCMQCERCTLVTKRDNDNNIEIMDETQCAEAIHNQQITDPRFEPRHEFSYIIIHTTQCLTHLFASMAKRFFRTPLLLMTCTKSALAKSLLRGGTNPSNKQ